MGIIKDSAATLLMTIDSIAESAVREPTCATAFFPVLARSRTSTDNAPDRCMPRLTTSIAPTVTTAGWPRPENASMPGMIPTTVSVNRASSATMS